MLLRRELSDDEDNDDDVDDDDELEIVGGEAGSSEPEVEGFMWNDTLYHREKLSNRVFASERDADGNRVQVGTWDPEQKVVVVGARDEDMAGVCPGLYPYKVEADD